MDTTFALLLAFTVATLAGLGAALSRPKALVRRILIGRLLISGMAGASAFALFIDKAEAAPEDYWKYLWVAVASGHAGPQVMQALYKKTGLGDDNEPNK